MKQFFGDMKQIFGEVNQFFWEIKQIDGELKQNDGEMKQDVLGEMPHRQSEITISPSLSPSHHHHLTMLLTSDLHGNMEYMPDQNVAFRVGRIRKTKEEELLI